MRHIRTRKVITIHHSLKLLNRRINKQTRMRAPAAAPYNIWWVTVIPSCGFGDDTGAFGGCSDVGLKPVEALIIIREGALGDLIDCVL
jgi:hypothetical protein